MRMVTCYRISLNITLITSMMGILFKLNHYPYANFLLAGSTFFSLGFILPGLQDVYRNRRSNPNEKWMWTLAMIFLSWIAGYLYWPILKRHIHQ